MLKLKWFGIVFASIITAGCSVQVSSKGHSDGSRIIGSGNGIEEVLKVSGYTGVNLTGSGKVVIEVNGKEGVTISGDDNILPILTANVEEGVLVLGTKENSSYSTNKDIFYKVSVKSLKLLSCDGSGSISAKGIQADSLKAKIAGSGNIEMSGTAKEVGIDIAGSGNLDSSSLIAIGASVDIAGSGSAKVNATGTLKVDISGSGSVHYKGDPIIKQTIMGSGTVHKL